MSNLTAYKNMRGILKTGDIVLFSGKNFFSNIIKFFSKSKWSHVGIVVRVDDLDMMLLWESTSLSDIPDAIDDIPKNGVQTVVLSSRLEAYDGNIAVRRLNGVVDTIMMSNLKRLRSDLKNKDYEQDKWELVKSLLDSGITASNRRDLSSIFCSELVAETLQAMGVIDKSISSNEFIPEDFADNGKFEHCLMTNFSYGPEIQIK